MSRRATILLLKTLILLAVLGSAWCACTHSAFAGERTVSSVALIERADYYNGKEVVYEGEVIGEILDRGDHAWITVNDDHYGLRHSRKYQELKGGNTGLGIYCRRDQLDGVRYLGSYGALGDYLRIRGVFYKSSPEHGGDLCIVADTVDIVRRGHRVETHPFGMEPIVAGALGAVWVLLLGIMYSRRRRAGA